MLVIPDNVDRNGNGAVAAEEFAVLGSHAERGIIDRFLAGNQEAGEQLFSHCRPSLLASIRVNLRHNGQNLEHVDEIEGQMWHRLLENDARLLARFDVDRGCRLTTYIAGLVSKEVLRFLRAERRRLKLGVQGAVFRGSLEVSSTCDKGIEFEEFLSTLTPAEHKFCENYLLAEHGIESTEYSDTNVWQLRHRIRLKLKAYLGHA